MNNKGTTGPTFSHVTFDDVDLFADFVKELDWTLESTQVSSGTYKLEFETFELPELSVSRVTTRQTVFDRFSVPDGAVVFNITRAKLPAIWNGRRLPPTVMGVYHPGIDHWAVLPAGWDHYEFTVSKRLTRQTELFPEDFFAKTRQFEHACLPLMEPVTCLPLMEPVTGHFIAQLDAFFGLARIGQARDVTAAPTIQFLDIVMQGLLEVVEAGLIAADKHKLDRARRPELVKKATDFVEGCLESQLSIQDMMHELNVSARVLNYAFRDNLGISPYRYILTRKLHAVRRELKSSEEPIVEIISRYGFATPSRFGRQYMRLFGELPSAARYRQK